MGFFGVNGVLILVGGLERSTGLKTFWGGYRGLQWNDLRELQRKRDPCRNKDCLRRRYPYLRSVMNIYMSTKEDVWLLTCLEFERFRWTKCWNPQLQPRSSQCLQTQAFTFGRRGHSQLLLICKCTSTVQKCWNTFHFRLDSIRSC